MCVLAFAWKAHPRWQLILAGNRDELHERPAAALAQWDDYPDLIAGRDLQSGGTWLGVSQSGRLAVVTNLRGHGDPDPGKASRGAIVSDYLTGAGDYADLADAALSDFNPFNLIVADVNGAQFLSNRPENIRSALASGIYGLSNGGLDEPWPKTLRIKEAMLEWFIGDADEPASILDNLREDALPDIGIIPHDPSDAPLEPILSPIFIDNPIYGTRCSTVVAVDSDGNGKIMERRYGPDGQISGQTELPFIWRAG